MINQTAPKVDVNNDEEINLAELLGHLWQGRMIIAMTTILLIVGAGAYAYWVKEKWTSHAVIETPRLEALGDYYKAQMDLRRITGNTTETTAEITQDIFVEFIRQLNSSDFRRQQFSSSAYYKQRVDSDKDDMHQHIFLDEMTAKSFLLTSPNGKQNIYNRVQMSAESPQDAQKLLTDYLNALNTQVWNTKLSEFNIRVKTLKLDLIKQMQDMRADADAQNRNLLDVTKRANDTAIKGGIDTFKGSSYQSVPEKEMLFLLGTRSLKARIQTLQDIPPALSAAYYQAERKLLELEQLPQLTTDAKYSFRFLASPSLPVQRDAPKRGLIVMLAAMAGLLLGCLIVLSRNAFLSLCRQLSAAPMLVASK